MIRILTAKDHLAFNMNSRMQELKLAGVLSYHLQNKTGKKVRIKCECGSFVFDPAEIVELTVENRRYDPRVTVEVENIISNLNKGEESAYS
jgi:hypothetical protein